MMRVLVGEGRSLSCKQHSSHLQAAILAQNLSGAFEGASSLRFKLKHTFKFLSPQAILRSFAPSRETL